MGNDLTVVNAARVSFAKESDWINNASGEESLSLKDAKLIRYLADHDHWTPFSQPQLQFRIKMPLFIARQWYKHQVGFTRNEVSRRYVDEMPEIFVPRVFRNRPTNGKKQGSEGEHEHSAHFRSVLNLELGRLLGIYEGLITQGVAPEQARIVLPEATYTEFYETGSLAAYSRLCRLRNSSDAQYETQRYAEAVSSIISNLFPVSWEALRGVNRD